MRNDSIKSAIVLSLSAILAAAETFAIATIPASPAAPSTSRTVATFDGRLEAGATAFHSVPFTRGHAYRVRVEAVAPGADVDLQLFSPLGREIDRAIGATNRPVVATVPSGSGRYGVDVTMARCPVQPCAYRLVVLER